MIPDDAAGSAEADGANAQSWPLPESEIADAEAILTQIHAMVTQIEQTVSQVRVYLATMTADAPALRETLLSTEFVTDRPQLTDLQAARGLRAELVKASQQSVAASQAASKYLQARERFIMARRDWITHTEK